MRKSLKIACVLFAYKRPRYLKRAIKTHKKIEGIDYFAFIDYSEIQKKIYEIIDEANIYKIIYQWQENKGLNANIIGGINHIFNLGYDAVIVLEDDLLLSDDAYFYLLGEIYALENDERFFSTSCHKGKFGDERFRCWAWAIWRDRWDKIDWSVKPKEKNRGSWDVIVNEYMQREKLLCRCSDVQRVKHIGWNGTHYSFLDLFSVRRWLSLFL
jgi:hypothetical protein